MQISGVVFVLICIAVLTETASAGEQQRKLAELGEVLFFDPNLSQSRRMSCASCHDPARGFADPGSNRLSGAVSLGSDGQSFGDRNAPTVTYAAFSPAFHSDDEGHFIGGQFWDGRAATLADQAMGPPLNPIEMAMPDRDSVRRRLLENPRYAALFRELYGEATLNDADAVYRAMAESIQAFEQSAALSPFDSKYDRYLRGEYRMTAQEELGRTLFFSRQFSNCNRCHQLEDTPMAARETFTSYQYHNIGVPLNLAVRAENGLGDEHVDRGLLQNPNVADLSQSGKFKVPTLRNVAVTGPYMHNGIFRDLETVVRFYNKYNSKNPASRINPETGEVWGEPEVSENLSLSDLTHGPALDERRIEALVAFLKTLTDRRYEALLE